MSADIDIDDDFDDGSGDVAAVDVVDDAVAKASSAKASLMKRRVIDELLLQKRLEKSLEDLNFDLDD